MEFYTSTSVPEVPSADLMSLDDDKSYGWERDAAAAGLWIASSPLILPQAIDTIAEQLGIAPEDVVAISEGFAFWRDGAVYNELAPGARLRSRVRTWHHDRYMWALAAASTEALPDELRRAAQELLNTPEQDPAEIDGFISEAAERTGPNAIAAALASRGFEPEGIVSAYFVPPASERPRVPRIGNMTVEHPANRCLRTLAMCVRHGSSDGAQEALHDVFERYGRAIPRHAFFELAEPTDPGSSGEEFFGAKPWSDAYRDDVATNVQGVAVVGEFFAIDFPFVTFLTTREGLIVSQWPSFGAKLVGAHDHETLSYIGPSWSIVQYDLTAHAWRRTLASLPRCEFREGMERAYVFDRTAGRAVRMESVVDYPVYVAFSPCGRYVGATTNEAIGGVYRHDGQRQFSIDQRGFSRLPALTLAPPNADPVDDDDEPGSDAFAFALVEGDEPRWHYASAEGYRVGKDPKTAFLPPAEALGFSRDGTELLVAGRRLSLLSCDSDGARLAKSFQWADLSSLAGTVTGAEDGALQAALSTYGTLDRFESHETLLALTVVVSFDTSREVTLGEASELVALADGVQGLKQLFTEVDGGA